MADAIVKAARRVRLDEEDAEVHELVETVLTRAGNVYRTRCDVRMYAWAGAMLTTRTADCRDCRGAIMVRSGLISTAVTDA